MTYKSVSERHNYSKRVASHATKAFANGLVLDIPPSAIIEFQIEIEDRLGAKTIKSLASALIEVKNKHALCEKIIELTFRRSKHRAKAYDKIKRKQLFEQRNTYARIARKIGVALREIEDAGRQ